MKLEKYQPHFLSMPEKIERFRTEKLHQVAPFAGRQKRHPTSKSAGPGENLRRRFV
jgi:hypothetical protein